MLTDIRPKHCRPVGTSCLLSTNGPRQQGLEEDLAVAAQAQALVHPQTISHCRHP